MALRNIRLEGDALLRKKAKAVTEITKSVRILLDDMTETMEAASGVGLAAPQVGILKRIVVIDVGDGLHELINPEIVETKGACIRREACLSLPGKDARVERPEYVKVKAKDRNFEDITVEGTGLMAVALCHEIDHLDGVLYVDRALPDDEDDEWEEA